MKTVSDKNSLMKTISFCVFCVVLISMTMCFSIQFRISSCCLTIEAVHRLLLRKIVKTRCCVVVHSSTQCFRCLWSWLAPLLKYQNDGFWFRLEHFVDWFTRGFVHDVVQLVWIVFEVECLQPPHIKIVIKIIIELVHERMKSFDCGRVGWVDWLFWNELGTSWVEILVVSLIHFSLNGWSLKKFV